MADLSKEQMLDIYHQMVLIRRFEEKCKDLFQQKRIGGVYLHLYNGQEATGVGSIRALGPHDHVITAYRDHGIAIARGVDLNRLMAEMMGKRTGVSGGKGGSMHLADRNSNFWGGYAIVGGHLPLAAGLALKSKYNDDGEVVLCFVGDGATNNGYFHEAVNLSAVWKLPVVWLIENNLYGMGTPVEAASGQTELYKRAISYGIEDYGRVDGMDVLAVYDAALQAVEFARKGGPVLMESMTYRYEGHGVSDRIYIKREEELRYYHDRDPLLVLATQMRQLYPDIDAALQAILVGASEAVEQAVQYAEESPDPTAEDLVSNIYA
jgi:pyruvate dehydrogenase E1 component alpha subunit